MSDALSEISRLQNESEISEAFLVALAQYLDSRRCEDHLTLLDAVEKRDGIPSGFWKGRLAVATSFENWLDKLLANHELTWLRLLRFARCNDGSLGHRYFGCRTYDYLKGQSPFNDKNFVEVSFGNNFVNISGDIEDLFVKLLKEQGMAVFDGDTYMMVLPNDCIEKSEWMHHFSYTNPIKGERTE